VCIILLRRVRVEGGSQTDAIVVILYWQRCSSESEWACINHPHRYDLLTYVLILVYLLKVEIFIQGQITGLLVTLFQLVRLRRTCE